MTREELQVAIENTTIQIYEIKKQIERSTELREKCRLTRKKNGVAVFTAIAY